MSMPQEFMFDGQETKRQMMYAGDDRLFVRFYSKACLHDGKSAEEGRPIYVTREYVTIMVPGDKNSVVDTPVTQQHKQRFASRYERFLKESEEVMEGTPLDIVPWLPVNLVAELKAMSVHTVEQLAGMSDSNIQKFQGFNRLRDRAQAFLDLAADEAVNTKMAKDLEERDMKIAAQAEQLAQLSARLDELVMGDKVAKVAKK